MKDTPCSFALTVVRRLTCLRKSYYVYERLRRGLKARPFTKILLPSVIRFPLVSNRQLGVPGLQALSLPLQGWLSQAQPSLGRQHRHECRGADPSNAPSNALVDCSSVDTTNRTMHGPNCACVRAQQRADTPSCPQVVILSQPENPKLACGACPSLSLSLSLSG